MDVTLSIPDKNSSIEEKTKGTETVCFEPAITKSAFWDKKLEEQTEWEDQLEQRFGNETDPSWRQYELHSIQVKLLRKIKDDMNSTKMFDEWLGDQKEIIQNDF